MRADVPRVLSAVMHSNLRIERDQIDRGLYRFFSGEKLVSEVIVRDGEVTYGEVKLLDGTRRVCPFWKHGTITHEKEMDRLIDAIRHHE